MAAAVRVQPLSRGVAVERFAQPGELVVDQRVHRIEDQAANGCGTPGFAAALLGERCRVRAPPGLRGFGQPALPLLGLFQERRQQGQKERLRLARPRAGGDHHVLTTRQACGEGLFLMLIERAPHWDEACVREVCELGWRSGGYGGFCE